MMTRTGGFVSGRLALLAVGASSAVAAVLGAWVFLAPTNGARFHPSGLRVLEVEMEMTGFEPSVVRIPAGEAFVLRLHTPESPFDFEGPTHQLAIDELGVDLRIGPGETVEAKIGPVDPGTYEFYCDLCCSGRANPAMIGELVVG